MREATAGTPRLFWDGEGDNPYPHFLAHADAFIVPADSVNMTGEPCATGKPVYVFEPEGGSAKFTRFHEALRRHGATRPLPERFERLETWSYVPLNSSETIAAEIARRWAKRRQMLGTPAAGACGRGLMPMAIPIVPLVVATALFMENTDSTILATALPTIARDLGLDPISLKLAVTSYLVSLAVFIPVSGWVADRVGACTTFRLALAVFMAASIGCAFSGSLGQFVFWRAVQGLGGAMMVPVGRMVVIRAVPKAELVRALSFIAMPALIGPMLGPPLGGLIVTYADWRWIFFVNIPIGILGIVLATLFIPEIKEETPPLDVKGFLLSAIGLRRPDPGHGHDGPAHRPAGGGGRAASSAGAGRARPLRAPRAERAAAAARSAAAAVARPSRPALSAALFFRFGVGASAFLLPLMLQLALRPRCAAAPASSPSPARSGRWP